jgi:hypothetical protein
MKQFYKYCIGYALLSFIFSCQHENFTDAIKIHHENFGETIHLTAEYIDFDEPLMKPVRMLLVDSILLVYNRDMDPLVQRYNLNTLKKTGECISFGGGPEDLLNIWNMQRSDSTVWLTDLHKKTCFNYRISDICFKDTFKSLYRISTDETFKDAWILPDHRVVTTTFDPSVAGRLSFFSPKGELIQRKGDYPSFGLDMTELEKMEGFSSQMTVNPSVNRIYVFCLATDLLEIYDMDGEPVKKIHGPDHFFPAVQEQRNGDMARAGSKLNISRDAFSSPVVVNDEIFVLYSGGYYNLESPNYRRDQLLVYDGEGNPLRKYGLSEKVFRIAVDAGNRIIYGLSDYPEFHLLGFRY